MDTLIKQLAELCQQLLIYIKSKMTPSEQIGFIAKSKLGTDFTDDKKVLDDVSCAYAVSSILHEQDPSVPIITGTASLLDYFRSSSLFERVFEPQAGTIVICATGQGRHPTAVAHGHTGIYLSDTLIASNSSKTGLWTQNYTRDSWRSYYYWEGGYPIYLFNKVA